MLVPPLPGGERRGVGVFALVELAEQQIAERIDLQHCITPPIRINDITCEPCSYYERTVIVELLIVEENEKPQVADYASCGRSPRKGSRCLRILYKVNSYSPCCGKPLGPGLDYLIILGLFGSSSATNPASEHADAAREPVTSEIASWLSGLA